MARKRFNEREVIETLLWQGISIRCYRCGHPLALVAAADDKIVWPLGPCEREHLHEVKLGGPDTPANCRYSHKSCHAIVTNGTPATTAGSSANRLAKANNPTRTDKFVVQKKPLDEPRERKRFSNTKYLDR